MEVFRAARAFRLVLEVLEMLGALEEDLAGHLEGTLLGEQLDVGALLHLLRLHGAVQHHVALGVAAGILAALLQV